VLDANTLMCAVLGRRVRELLERYEDSATFYSPDVCFDDARHYLSKVLEKRGFNVESGLAVLEQISQLVVLVDRSLYGDYERLAREQVEIRDPDDWRVLAVALMLDLPIWTEDQDLFGSGVATWTTDPVEVYLKVSD
jgi:predicted nucleic acid-binding protein